MNKMKLSAKIYSAIIFIFLFAPIAVLLVFSFNEGKSLSVFSGFCKIYENHPWKRIIIRRDAMSGEESSLEEIFCWQG